MATINGTQFNDNNTNNNGQFRPQLVGTAQADTINGLAGNDRLFGLAGNDVLNGGPGNDTLVGGTGRDTLNGGAGNDNIRSDGDGGIYRGGAGNDVMFSANGPETLDGGIGVDLINHTAWAGDYVFNMETGLTNFPLIERFTNFENATMGSGNDSVTGNASNNVINGGAGNDALNGGAGNDTLIGGLGRDTMTGGPGTNTFRYSSPSESAVGTSRDVVTDFSTFLVDKLDLSRIDADLGAAGNQAFTFIGTNNFSGNSGEVRYSTSGGNLIVQVDRLGDGNILPDMEIQLNGIASISAANFIL